VLVHGAAADHTAWRTAGPLLATSNTLFAVDRRGRGASGDTLPYSIAREYEDAASVVDEVFAATGRRVDLIGHSFGGRIGLGTALLTPNLRSLVVYEGAPAPEGRAFHGEALMAELATLAEAGDRAGLLTRFLETVVGMTDAQLEAYRESPSWPARVAAAPTIIREMWAEAGEASGPERYSAVRAPVLQIVGQASSPLFTDGTWALDELLPNARVAVIPGAGHAAHHTHPERFVAEVRAFLDASALEDVGASGWPE
jgi:pimeloyl-ACP methyl ester carboxylesterase